MTDLNQILFPCSDQPKAILALADGTVFTGTSFGYHGESVGEVVFNTALTGYQEILSDPSYAGQMVTLTYPHIGNTGTNAADDESGQVHAKALIVRSFSEHASNFRNEQELSDYLNRHQVVAITGIDTRELTQKLRQQGSLNACLVVGDDADVDLAIAKAQAHGGTSGQDLAKVVSRSAQEDWDQGTYDYMKQGFIQSDDKSHHVVCYDFGVKSNILRILSDLNCRLTVVPAQTPASEVLAMKPDGVFLSNGPGDPAACDYAIAACREFLDATVPLFGICLGHQIMALASDLPTIKMKFGHHGANHPVEDCANKTVMITSQNHNYAVDETGLPSHVEVTHRSLFDGSVQGIRRTDKPAYGFQGHPEASPGPHEAKKLFLPFIESMQQVKG